MRQKYRNATSPATSFDFPFDSHISSVLNEGLIINYDNILNMKKCVKQNKQKQNNNDNKGSELDQMYLIKL